MMIVAALLGGTSLLVSGSLPVYYASEAWLLFGGHGIRLTTLLFFIIPLEGYVAEEDEHFLWQDAVLLSEIEPKIIKQVNIS